MLSLALDRVVSTSTWDAMEMKNPAEMTLRESSRTSPVV